MRNRSYRSLKMKVGILVWICVVAIPGMVMADGMIVIPEPIHMPSVRRTPFPLEVKYHHVDVIIKDQVATTYIDQEFYNPTQSRLEGYYIFPIPQQAVINKFSILINGKEVAAELLDAKKARSIYEDIVRRQIDPALLEYYGTGLFKARIFPIDPHSTKRVKITYNEILTKNNNTVAYRYPLNTEKFSAKPLQSVSINVDIESSDPLKSVFCTTHETDTIRKSNHKAIVSYEQNQITPDTDFKIFYSTDSDKFGAALVTYREPGNPGYFLLNISPANDLTERDIDPKDITFVLDVSGSMAGDKLNQAKKALRFCVANLNHDDRLDIIRFSTEATSLFKALKPATQDNRLLADQFISNLRPIGGTNIEEALNLAFSHKPLSGRQHMIVFITDGKPTIGETHEERLLNILKKTNIDQTRVFTFGIGEEINTHLLDKLTVQTNAYRTYIEPDEDIEVKISDFFTKVSYPVLSNIELTFEDHLNVFKMYPKDLPDLFKGSTVSIMGRYEGQSKSHVKLTGNRKGKTISHTFDLYFDKSNLTNEFIPSLWAARRIGYLLDQIRLNGEDKELIDEIVDLARTYGIITPYTSLLIVEDETRQIAGQRLVPMDKTINYDTPQSEDLIARSKREYKSMEEKSGKASIRASKEIQTLSKSYNKAQTMQGASRMAYKNKKGVEQNLTQQVKFVSGRAVYNNGTYWIDSKVQNVKAQKPIRIRFATKAYFTLLKTNPDLAPILALGKSIRFVHHHKVYEIYE